MPEGDTLHRAARALQVLVGETLAVEALHPRARATRVAERLDGRRLESVEALGKNLVLRFGGGVVLRSHLRMSGSWSVVSSATAPHGTPWLVLRGSEHQAVLRGGPVLELHTRALARLGPDILANPPDVERMLDRLARAEGQRTLGETLQDQSLVAGIGNMWMAEALWLAELSPWSRLADVDPAGRRAALESAAELMHAALEGGRERARQVYGRVGRPCRRCGTPIRAFGQGDAHRTAYWCPGCQVGAGLPTREPARPAGS